MKKLITVIFLIFPCILISQEQSYYPGEMYLGTANVNPPTQNLTFTIEAQGKVWAGSYPPRTYWSTDDYDVSTFTPHENNEWPPNQWRGWDFVTDITSNPPYYIPIYAYGLYKLSTNHSSEYFYLDFRDDRYGYYSWYQPPTFGHAIDLWIKYDANTQKFSYSSTGSASDPFITVSNAELIPIWEMKQKGQQHTSLFPSYWQNCLAVTNDGDAHPRFVWGPYPATLVGSIVEYRIYRSGAHIPGQPPGNFSLLGTVEPDEFEYIDYTVEMGSDYNARSYYVTCFYEDPWDRGGETQPTNTVEVRLGIPHKISGEDNNLTKTFQYELKQNYPNPFNPLTTIEFSLKENSFVTLKVFDVLGSEVATLVNENKEAGTHSVRFNAVGLPSGIYLYKIEGDKFLENRKMIILK